MLDFVVIGLSDLVVLLIMPVVVVVSFGVHYGDTVCQVGGFLQVLLFPPPIKLTGMI
jgi:hypothetical protein